MEPIIELPADQIEYTPSIDLSGTPSLKSGPLSWRGRVVKIFITYPSNIVGYIPFFGSIVGLMRIVFSLVYRIFCQFKFSYEVYSEGLFKAKSLYDDRIEWVEHHQWRGMMEMIPFWNLFYLITYDFVLVPVDFGRFNFY